MAVDMKAVKDAYATYNVMPEISYKILEHLMTNPEAEIIWKLLKYNDADAWAKDNLTREEKAAMIYNGMSSQDDFNVFLDFFMDEATNKEKSFLRIYPAAVDPTTRTYGICSVNIEVFIHSQINHLSNYTTRLDTIIQKLLEILNGCDIGGVGVLFFDDDATSYNRIITAGEKPYKGKIITMGVILS